MTQEDAHFLFPDWFSSGEASPTLPVSNTPISLPTSSETQDRFIILKFIHKFKTSLVFLSLFDIIICHWLFSHYENAHGRVKTRLVCFGLVFSVTPFKTSEELRSLHISLYHDRVIADFSQVMKKKMIFTCRQHSGLSVPTLMLPHERKSILKTDM